MASQATKMPISHYNKELMVYLWPGHWQSAIVWGAKAAEAAMEGVAIKFVTHNR